MPACRTCVRETSLLYNLEELTAERVEPCRFGGKNRRGGLNQIFSESTPRSHTRRLEHQKSVRAHLLNGLNRGWIIHNLTHSFLATRIHNIHERPSLCLSVFWSFFGASFLIILRFWRLENPAVRNAEFCELCDRNVFVVNDPLSEYSFPQ